MKTRIFRSTKGWYIYGTNYKDKEDKAYMSLFFPQNSEPNINGDYIDIEIEEAKYTSYKGKIGMTIFKYLLSEETGDQEPIVPAEISPDDLPFY